MNHEDKNQLPPVLAAHTASMIAIEANESDVQQAQLRLEAALARLPSAKKSVARRWLLAGSTACAIGIISMLPLFGDHNGVAFAQVQKHFVNFKTMAFTIEQRYSGQLQLVARVQINQAGDVRTDVDKGVSVIVSPNQKQVLTLMHDTREAMQFPLDVTPVVNNETTDWLKEIQAYKNVATPFSKTRIIDGKTANGWILKIKGMRTEIWADDDGIPIIMTMDDGDKLNLNFSFKFNPALASNTFSTNIPSNYSPVQPDD